jgi:hypothetical protein
MLKSMNAIAPRWLITLMDDHVAVRLLRLEQTAQRIIEHYSADGSTRVFINKRFSAAQH